MNMLILLSKKKKKKKKLNNIYKKDWLFIINDKYTIVFSFFFFKWLFVLGGFF